MPVLSDAEGNHASQAMLYIIYHEDYSASSVHPERDSAAWLKELADRAGSGGTYFKRGKT
jgi:hypothetical protein